MKWWPDNCQRADMIRVKIGSVWHYGIFISDDEVIQFGPPPTAANLALNRDNKIMSVSIEEFSEGNIVERAILSRDELRRRIPHEKTVEIARSRLGEGGYNIIHNNCEHFAMECVFGQHRSLQEQAVRDKWLKRPILDVYVMKIPQDTELQEVYPPRRQEQLSETKNQNSRLERYAVWQLLKTAIERSFSLAMEDINFVESKGKWSCDKLSFSLSHSHGVVAVAVSNAPCGVDIEAMERFKTRYSDKALLEKMRDKICSKEEKISLNTPEDFIELWTKKECIYKCFGKEGFFTKKINTLRHESVSQKVFLPEEYFISFCGEKLNRARVFVYTQEGFQRLT